LMVLEATVLTAAVVQMVAPDLGQTALPPAPLLALLPAPPPEPPPALPPALQPAPPPEPPPALPPALLPVHLLDRLPVGPTRRQWLLL
jgi:hypothetical protein